MDHSTTLQSYFTDKKGNSVAGLTSKGFSLVVEYTTKGKWKFFFKEKYLSITLYSHSK